MSESLPGLRTSSPALPGTPSVAQTGGLKSDRFQIEDYDLDELAESIPDSSPYFTQPTQLVNRKTQPTQIIDRTTQPTQIIGKTTQPTQILEKRTTLHRSSPPVPDTPNSVVEVPASSPFQSMSQQQRRPAVKAQATAGGRLASMMAPAGTAFRSPVASALPRRPQPAVKRQFLSTIASDDDLADDYKRHDSSDDDKKPMRGEIRPSSFVKKQRSPPPTFKSGFKSDYKDLNLNDIPDLRLRYLTKQAHRSITKARPEITIRQCRDALVKHGLSSEDATRSLMGEAFDNPMTSTHSFNSKNNRTDTMPRKSINQQSKSWQQTKLSVPQKPRDHSSSPPSSPGLVKNNAPRRRLMRGRANRTPSPEKVFSVPSSHTSSSAVTTPTSSSSEHREKMAISGYSQSQDVISRHRPAQGTHKRPYSELEDRVITIDSDTDEDSDGFPPLEALTKKRRTSPSAEQRKPSRLVNRATKIQAEAIKHAKTSKKEAEKKAAKQAKNLMLDLTEEYEAFVKTDDSDASGSEARVSQPSQEHAMVREYLNKCSSEELARMTGYSIKDAQLVVSKRPFKMIAEVEKIRAKTATTKKSAKSKKHEVGLNIVSKLDTWFKAFDSVTSVINECDARGQQLQAIMNKWDVDRNGMTKEAGKPTQQLERLPITKRPALMADDIELKNYQMFGLNWMNLLHSQGYSGILADDMGLGKTCQVISFISHLVKVKPDAKPNIIIVPPSTLENWVNEFDRFAPDINLYMYQGTNRKDYPHREARQADVVLTSYSMVDRQLTDIVWLAKLEPYAAIFDEGHKLKNPNALVYKNLTQLPSEWRLVLTGTPVQNNLKELLGLLSFVEPKLFEGGVLDDMHTIFEAKVPNKDVLNFAALAKERVASARTIMVPFILQRRKDEVLGLPRKIDTLAQVEMTGSQKALYEEIKGNFLHGKSKGGNSTDKGNLWQQLRKAAIHPHLFRRHFTDETVGKMVDILWKKCSDAELAVQSKSEKHKEMYQRFLLSEWDFSLHLLCKEFPKYIGKFDIPHRSWEEAPKVQKLLELVKRYQENGDRCLVFSRYEMVIDILRDAMHYADIDYCELTGRSSVAARFPEIEKFNDNPDIPVFLLTTGAGGTGLNLTAANKIILFDQSDNPQDDVQASNRAHRIGQSREVEVIRLISQQTVETMIYNSCIKKLALAASVEGQIEDEESLEEICRQKMLFGDEEEEIAVPPSQVVVP